MIPEAFQLPAFAAAGVAFLIGLSWMLGFHAHTRIIDLDTIAAAHGVELTERALDINGRAGIGLTPEGRVLVAKTMGQDIAVRVLPTHSVESVRVHGQRVRIAFADLGFPVLTIEAYAPPLWLGRLPR